MIEVVGESSGSNSPPIWQTVPDLTFTVGVAATISVAGFVSDEDGDALTITKNAVDLPPGVTFDALNQQFVYDGSGSTASTSGHELTADDGHD